MKYYHLMMFGGIAGIGLFGIFGILLQLPLFIGGTLMLLSTIIFYIGAVLYFIKEMLKS